MVAPPAVARHLLDKCERIVMGHTMKVVNPADEEAVKKIVSATVMNLWEAVDTLTFLPPTRHERCRVSIFGSARAGPGTFACDEAKRAAVVRHVEHVPRILVGRMWRALVDRARASKLENADLRLASPTDLDIPRCLDSADEAIASARTARGARR